MFSKKVTKIEEIITVDLTLCSKRQINGEDFVNFLAFLESMNFTFSFLDGIYLYDFLLGNLRCFQQFPKVWWSKPILKSMEVQQKTTTLRWP